MALKNKHGVEIKVGQKWRDCDKRFSDRVCEVVGVDEAAGTVELLGPRNRITKVKASRMHKSSTGYELLMDIKVHRGTVAILSTTG